MSDPPPTTPGSAVREIVLHTFGVVDVRADSGQPLSTVLLQPKRSAVLFYLALARPHGRHRRDTLLGLLWPEMPEERARASLRRALHFLRAALGPEIIVGRGDDELSLTDAGISCDAWDFEALVDRGGTGDLEAAVALYRGDLLAGFVIDDAPAWERWLDQERDRLRRRALRSATELARQARTIGEAGRAAEWARRGLEISEDDEEAMRQLLLALDAQGERASALQTYEAFARRIASDHDAEPAAETQAVIGRIRARRELAAHVPAVTDLSARRSPLPLPQLPQPSADLQNDPALPPPERHEALADSPVLVSEVTPAPPRRRMNVRSIRRNVTLMAGVALGMILGAVVAAVMTGGRASPSGGQRMDAERIVVLPFTVRGGAEYVYLQDGLVDLLAARLDGVGPLRVVDPRAMQSFLNHGPASGVDPEVGRGAARRFDAGRFVLGNVVGVGGRLQITASVYDADGHEMARAEATGAGERDLFSLVDRISRGIVVGGLPGAGARLGRDAAVTTTGLAALKAFLAGEQERRAGHSEAAVDAYQRAIAADSTFALALYRLSTTAEWASHRDLAISAMERALRYIDRLPPRDRMLLRARAASNASRMDEAEQIYRGVLAEYPDDIEAWQQLGEALFHIGPWRGRPLTGARDAFEHVIALDSGDVNARQHLLRIAAVERRLPALDSLADVPLRGHPEWAEELETQALEVTAMTAASPRASARRASTGATNTDGMKLASLRLLAADPSAYDNALWLAGWRVATFSDDPDAARPFATALEQSTYPVHAPVLGYTLSAHLDAARGQWGVAAAELNHAARLDPLYAAEVRANLATHPFLAVPRADLEEAYAALDRVERIASDTVHDRLADGRDRMLDVRRAYLLGLLDLRLGRPFAAEVHAQALDAIGRTPTDGAELARHLAHQLRARLLWKQGDAARALSVVESGWPVGTARASLPIFQGETYTEAGERFLRAELLAALGRDRDALAWYDTMTEDLGCDLAYQRYTHVRRAAVLEKLGRRAEAREQYVRFISDWEHADAAMQGDIRLARARISALQ